MQKKYLTLGCWKLLSDLLNNKEISGNVDEEKQILIINDKTDDYPCPNCKKNIKFHWIICPYCQTELE